MSKDTKTDYCIVVGGSDIGCHSSELLQ